MVLSRLWLSARGRVLGPVTYPDACPLCGGEIMPGWDEDEPGRCIGWCGLRVDHIESLSPEQRRRWLVKVNRRKEIAAAAPVSVQESFL